jgi:alpha-beta hydrolase superfamily lysophospholipase
MIRVSMFIITLILVVVAVILVLGPREAVDGSLKFSADALGSDLDGYLAAAEAKIPEVKDTASKRILWANPAVRNKTEYSVVYVHGFSGALEELRPVPDDVADTLGANLFFTRLKGHGRNGEAMAEARVVDWREDMAEAMEIGRRIGDKVIVIGTSTGGTLATLAAFDARMNKQLAGLALISPNFGVQSPGAFLLTQPYSRKYLPWLLGPERSWKPANAEFAQHWTTRYPTEALVPMAALVKYVRALDMESARIPALFAYSNEDRVVRPERTREVYERWGGPKKELVVTLGPDDDASHHVIAGRIASPSQTERLTEEILSWTGGL